MVHIIETYGYIILFFAAFSEGPAVSVIAGYVSKLGYLSIVITVVVLVIADIVSDMFYYHLGYFSLKNKKIRLFVEKKLFTKEDSFIFKMWDKNFFKTMFFGKMAYGISVPIIISAGVLKINLKKFLSYSVPVSCFQTSVLVISGYIMGEAYYGIIKYTKYAAYLLTASFLVFFVILYYTKISVRKALP